MIVFFGVLLKRLKPCYVNLKIFSNFLILFSDFTQQRCKILESINKDKIMDHLLENNLISDSQHGFMPGRSCATNLVEFMDFVTESVDEGESVDIFTWTLLKHSIKYPDNDCLENYEQKVLNQEQ